METPVSEPRHAPPFYCPYCGEEDIRPHGQDAGEWRCELCRRVWRLRYVGTVTPDLVHADHADHANQVDQVDRDGAAR